MKRIIVAIALSLVLAGPAAAGYVVLGNVYGTVCSGLGIKVCGPKEIVAVGSKGELYEFAPYFESVDEYKSKDGKGRCTIITSSGNMLTDMIKKTSLPDFYARENGELVIIKPDYITFDCRKD